MFQKIIGIIGIFTVAGVIVMVALSPRAEGFFPGMSDFFKRVPKTETSGTGTITPLIPVPASTVPQAGTVVAPNSQGDTLSVEQQRDTIPIE